MRIFILISLLLAFYATLSYARECPIGYEPPVVSFYICAEDIKNMGLVESDQGVVEEKLSAFKAKESALKTEFRNKNADIAMLLSAQAPDRSKADALAGRLTDIIRELNDFTVSYTVEMAELLKPGNLSKVKITSRHRLAHCDESIAVPKMRYVLSSKEKEIIGLLDDEKKYFEDFERREAYFAAEKVRVHARLDHAMRVQFVDLTKVKILLGELIMLIRQQATNRLDRYFYAEQILFSSERMEKLRAFNGRHKK